MVAIYISKIRKIPLPIVIVDNDIWFQTLTFLSKAL